MDNERRAKYGKRFSKRVDSLQSEAQDFAEGVSEGTQCFHYDYFKSREWKLTRKMFFTRA